MAQATGSGGASEPSVPSVCEKVSAHLYVASSGAPSSEADSDEATDKTAIQNAMNACKPGSITDPSVAVELVASGSNNAFLIGPLSIPSNVVLLVDGGITVFASRDPSVFQNGTVGDGTHGTCGTDSTLGNGCKAIFTTSNTSGSGIMGFGVVDGRGNLPLCSAPCSSGSFPNHPWYWEIQNVGSLKENNPDMLSAVNAQNFMLDNITFKNSPHFNVRYAGTNGSSTVTSGLVVYGMKIINAGDVGNTDGIDPVNNVSGITITESYISNGDDGIAVSSEVAGSPASNITISNMRTFDGSGISIGTPTEGDISNVLVENITQSGSNISTSQSGGFKIKSSDAIGGHVDNVTFENICQQNEGSPMRFYTNGSGYSGSGYPPNYTNILVQDVNFLANNAGSTADPTVTTDIGDVGLMQIQGYHDSTVTNTTMLTLDNVYLNGAPDAASASSYADITLNGDDNGASSYFSGLASSTVAIHNHESGSTIFSCPAGTFQELAGDLYLTPYTAPGASVPTDQLTLTVHVGDKFYVNAMVEPAGAPFFGTGTGLIKWPALTGHVNFDVNGSSLVSANLTGNGTVATTPVQTATATGTYVYTAWYAGDTHYGSYQIGSYAATHSVTVTVIP